MKKRINKLDTIVLVTLAVLTLNSIIFSQSNSNGVIDFIFKPQNNWTQFVIWMEDENGEYFETVFITNFIGRRGGGNRTSDRNIDSPDGNRLSTFPIWSHRRGIIDTTFGIQNYYPPAQNQPTYPEVMNAVSGATPKPAIQTKTLRLSDLPYGKYSCWIEVNQSFDFNQYHNYSFYRGQPSLVWSTTIDVGDLADSNMVLDYSGYGSIDGSHGEINLPDSTITTAVNLLQDFGGYKFKVIYTPKSVNVSDDFCSSRIEKSFSLDQNFPNPFNSTTEIGFFLPKSNHVNLTIYNIYGQKVAHLLDRQETAGYKRVTWDGKNLRGQEVSNGLYFCKIQAGEDAKIMIMVFLK